SDTAPSDSMTVLDPAILLALAVIGLVGGIGITAIGPGGVLATIALFALTDLTAPEVAGTAIVTHIGTGLLATAAYVRSGQLRERHTRRDGLALAATAVVGAPLGVVLNLVIPGRLFGLLLAVLVIAVAVLVWLRERHDGRSEQLSHQQLSHRQLSHQQLSHGQRSHPQLWVVATIGTAVAAASGIVG